VNEGAGGGGRARGGGIVVTDGIVKVPVGIDTAVSSTKETNSAEEFLVAFKCGAPSGIVDTNGGVLSSLLKKESGVPWEERW